VYKKPVFVDQDWTNPNLERYLIALERHKPNRATVLDWERAEQLPEILLWIEAIEPIVDTVIVIPKIRGGIARLKSYIKGKNIILGYSAPSDFSHTPVHLSEFLGWPVHILGGCPIRQLQTAGRLDTQERLLESNRLEIVSVDCNYHLKMATTHAQFCVPSGTAWYAKNRYWPTMREFLGKKWKDGKTDANAHHEAFRRSCKAIREMWSGSPPPGAGGRSR
jgi:hypothetical protein